MRSMKTTVPATPVRMESARTESTSTNVCAALDIQVGLTLFVSYLSEPRSLEKNTETKNDFKTVPNTINPSQFLSDRI